MYIYIYIYICKYIFFCLPPIAYCLLPMDLPPARSCESTAFSKLEKPNTSPPVAMRPVEIANIKEENWIAQVGPT